MKEKYITKNNYFGWYEFIVSDEHPDLCKKFFLTNYDKMNISLGVEMIFDPWRLSHKENSIFILSGKRSPELNEAVGGSANSDHLTANAIDIRTKGMSAEELFCSLMPYYNYVRQLILYPEKQFVHVSWNIPGKVYKNECFIKY